MTTDNLAIWHALEVTDEKFTKPVSRPGGFKGRAVDPVYNLKRVTEVLGPVGYAWGWHVLSERLDTFGAGEDAVTIHSMTVRAWFKQEDGSTREVDEIGLTTVAQYQRTANVETKRRLVVDEEYGKKSLTDALSKVMMSLGASSDIWMGRFDGNKYVSPEDWPALNGNEKDKTTEAPKPSRQRPAPDTPPDFIERQRRPEINGNAVSNGRVKLSPSQEVDAALGEEADPLNLRMTKGAKAKHDALDLALRSAQTPGEVWSLWDTYQERAKAFDTVAEGSWALLDDYVATRIMDMKAPKPRNPLIAG